MTLSTNVYVLDDVSPTDVFRFCQDLLAKYDDRPGGPHPQIFDDREGYDQDGSRRLANNIGQGLPAILDISYRVGAPLRAADAAHDENCHEDCTGAYHKRACWLDVDFDTAYGYRDKAGRGCGDLHALLVAELGQWLTERGVRWEWRNEFTGEVHSDPASLIELVSGGFEATAWFRTSVLPAIVAELGEPS
jgi:hypothetical protein